MGAYSTLLGRTERKRTVCPLSVQYAKRTVRLFFSVRPPPVRLRTVRFESVLYASVIVRPKRRTKFQPRASVQGGAYKAYGTLAHPNRRLLPD